MARFWKCLKKNHCSSSSRTQFIFPLYNITFSKLFWKWYNIIKKIFVFLILFKMFCYQTYWYTRKKSSNLWHTERKVTPEVFPLDLWSNGWQRKNQSLSPPARWDIFFCWTITTSKRRIFFGIVKSLHPEKSYLQKLLFVPNGTFILYLLVLPQIAASSAYKHSR